MRIGTLWLALVAVGCGDADPCDAVQDLAASPAGIRLTEAEHPGWGREQCAQCHHLSRMHRADCIEDASIDVVAIDALIDLADPTTCVSCHGDNGVEALRDTDDGEEP